ncbi:MAG: YraN family protein [Phycisphaerales bacterium]|nr:YraN family protein [Phycisphaerales bacterium]
MSRRGAGDTRWTGRRGERIAAAWLRRRGYRITGRNILRGSREVDLLGTSPDGRQQVVVEVKAGSGTFEQLAGRVDAGKRRRICSVAAGLQGGTLPVRFDVVLVRFMAGGGWDVRHLPGAFGAPS